MKTKQKNPIQIQQNMPLHQAKVDWSFLWAGEARVQPSHGTGLKSSWILSVGCNSVLTPADSLNLPNCTLKLVEFVRGCGK